MKQCCEKGSEKTATTAVQWPHLARLPPSPVRCLFSKEPMPMHMDDGENGPIRNDIREGCLFEIDHFHLPPTSPPQLRSIRVAMVRQKTESIVVIRYPSMASLRAFFNYTTKETHPTLDGKFSMDSGLAAKVFVKLIPPHVFNEEKSSESFWLIGKVCKDYTTFVETKGTCLSVLKENGMINWGVRRQVKHLGRHIENDLKEGNTQISSSSLVGGVSRSLREEKYVEPIDGQEIAEEEEEEEENDKDQVEEEEDESGCDDEDEEVEEKFKVSNSKNLKRKRYPLRSLSAKKQREEKHEEIRKSKSKKNSSKKTQKSRIRYIEAHLLKDPKGRWSSERYNLAEENLLAVMKVKGATAEKPILRLQLREEARKKIGDTGLLDHLLKHMAGRLAPGGQERFRRRHNPNGAMEYWLENADLVNIREEAGVKDVYWVPPPGWKLGDSPNQDPVCARELKLLRDEVLKIRSDMELVASKMQLKEELEKLRSELEKMNSEVKQGGNGAALTSSNFNFGSVKNCNDPLLTISNFVKEMEGRIKKLKPNSEEKVGKTSNTRQQVLSLHGTGAETQESGEGQVKTQTTAVNGAEGKAAKIERLKSGFRICKPQGTFLWPNMVKDNRSSINSNSNSSKSISSPVVFQFGLPTPPSVSSSPRSLSLPDQSQPFIVKPLAEKRPIMVSLNTLSCSDLSSSRYSSTITSNALENEYAMPLESSDYVAIDLAL